MSYDRFHYKDLTMMYWIWIYKYKNIEVEDKFFHKQEPSREVTTSTNNLFFTNTKPQQGWVTHFLRTRKARHLNEFTTLLK